MRFPGRSGQTLFILFCTFILAVPIGALAQPSLQAPPKPVGSSDARQLLPFITESLLQKYLNRLCAFEPRYCGSINCTLASEWIHDKFAAMGLPVEYHEWKFAGYKSRDVVATLPGKLPESDGVYVVCGHYDTVEVSPGADDDGSGAMAVLAIADALKNQTLNHTIKFITFSGEEVGTWGSLTYARDASVRGDNIIAALNVDMIGYANTTQGGKIIQFHTVERSQWINEYASEISLKYRDAVDISVYALPNYRGSDHQAFLDYGYDSVWIDHNDGYPWGHSAYDNTSHINWSYYAKATRFMLALTWEMAMRPIPVQICLTAPSEGTEYFFNHPVAHITFARDWFSSMRGTTIIFGRAMARATVITAEPIQYVVFCIDDNFLSFDSAPPFEWKVWGWFIPIFGKHTLKVFAYTTLGHVATDEMDLHVFSITDSFTRPHANL